MSQLVSVSVEAVVIVGVPKEVKNHEYRVGLTPASVRELVTHDIDVVVERGAGEGASFSDQDFVKAGASILEGAREVFSRSELIVKVKEPQLEECAMLSDGQTLFTYLHLAADPAQAEALLNSGAVAIAYETVTDSQGRLPLLTPMSEVAGRMSVQVGAHCLEKAQGGAGVLLGGVPGVEPARVAIIGGGVSGTNAAYMAVGMGADVSVLDISGGRLRELDGIFQGRVRTVHSNRNSIEHCVKESDLVIGAALIPGKVAPILVSREMISAMKPGSVVVDIAIDQGGCFETSRPTTHEHPTYLVDGVVHYCVTNIPGAVPRTSALALNNATLPFVLELARKGVHRAIAENPNLASGVNIWNHGVAHAAVADALNKPFAPLACRAAA